MRFQLRCSCYLLLAALLIGCRPAGSVAPQLSPSADAQLSLEGMVLIPSGRLHMGGDSEQASADEFPKHYVSIDAYYMDIYEVTNAQFRGFVEATGYQTVAEQWVDWQELRKQLPPGAVRPPDSVLAPGALVFEPSTQPVSLRDPQVWWRWTIGADWQHPSGIGSTIDGIADHPVVQVAWDDAVAYCRWARKRLPTEAEWEWAARGGQADMVYPWGNTPIEEGPPKANYYQGLFPYENSLLDGYGGTAPVGSFAPNGYGLFDMAGNVWEWCADWYTPDYYSSSTATARNTQGPVTAYNPSRPYQQERVIRGGSFLCNDDYCSGYRNARRMGSTADTGLNHTGFRCVCDVPTLNRQDSI